MVAERLGRLNAIAVMSAIAMLNWQAEAARHSTSRRTSSRIDAIPCETESGLSHFKSANFANVLKQNTNAKCDVETKPVAAVEGAAPGALRILRSLPGRRIIDELTAKSASTRNKMELRTVAVVMSDAIQRPRFHRAQKSPTNNNAVDLRMFSDPEGLVCVVSAPIPKWGLRVFMPSSSAPDRAVEALAYAQFLREFLAAERVDVELDPDVHWQEDWGDLVSDIDQSTSQ